MSVANKKYQQVYQTIIQWIESEVLLPGDKLPSIRTMANRQAVSKNTVIEAYNRLEQNNIISARYGSGFYVLTQEVNDNFRYADNPLQRAYDRIGLLTDQLMQPYDCKPGDGRYPRAWMNELHLENYLGLSNQPLDMLQHALEYGNPRGHQGLISALQSKLSPLFPKLTAANMLTTAGTNHAFDLIIRHYLKKGDKVMVEAPGYYPLFSKLEMAQIKLIAWTRSSTPDLYQLASILKKRKPKILFFQPYAHNPTGSSMSEQVVYEICEICHRHQTIVVIDDPFAHLLNNSHAYWPNAIYLSSFSKTLSASLRCGYVIAEEHCIHSLLKLKTVTMVNTSAFNEAILYDILISGKYEQHLCALKQHLSEQAVATFATLNELKSVLKISPYSDGLYLWAKLPSHISDMQLAEKSAKAGILLSPGKLFYPTTAPYSALRLNVAYSADRRLLKFLQTHLT